jgi:hypothetical protein
MSKDEKQSGIVLPNSGVIVAAILASGTYWFAQEEPLRGSRPELTQAQISEQAGIQQIDARLWQDPIAAVASWRDKRKLTGPRDACASQSSTESKGTDGEVEDHRCRSPLHDETGNAQVLGVTMSGARYPQDSESRLRTRYAVLAGLNRAGFVPVDAQHIDYFVFRPSPKTQSAAVVVPYEWFRSTDTHVRQRVLVFWLDEDSLGRESLSTFEELAEFLNLRGDSANPDEERDVKMTILGPEWSGTLRRMAREACGKGPQPDTCAEPEARWPGLKNVSFITFSASTPDKRVLRKISTLDVHDFFSRYGIDVQRILVPDDLLAERIVREMKHRGVDPGKADDDHIALITEWDTLYGQTMPETFKEAFFGKTFDQHKGDQVHELKYLRGLDGQLPGQKEVREGEKKAARAAEPAAKDRNGVSAEIRELERPVGQSQFDYLRRLAVSLREKDKDLRYRRSGGIEAIGVLGSDVFDKLLILQALRPHFPKALFFTTDLDLALTLPRELGWTRNLIVASSFDLELASELQGPIAPFRSAFQTAAFLATLVALHDSDRADRDGLEQIARFVAERQNCALAVRLFEIGRTGDLIAFADVEETPAPHIECATTDQKIHPAIPDPYPKLDRFSVPFFFAFAVLIVALGLALRFAPPLRERSVSFLGAAKSNVAMVGRGLALSCGIVGVAFVSTFVVAELWLALANGLTRSGEPLTLLQGASVWPTLSLRLLGTVCAAGFMWYGLRRLRTNLRDISEALEIGEDIDTTIVAFRRSDSKLGPWDRFAKMFSYTILRSGNAVKPYNIARAWRIYVHQERFVARSWRILAWLGFSFSLVVVGLWGDWTDFARGTTTKNAYLWITSLDLIFTIALVIFVFDVTLFFWLFVKEIRDTATLWPDGSKRYWQDTVGVDSQFVDDWIDLEFIAKRTKCIAELVFYPFIVIGLTILSCCTTLAHFPPSLPFLVIQGAGALVVVVCAVGLRLEAERARSVVKAKIREEIEKESDSQRAGKLHKLLNRVENLHEGAFRPWSRQPVVHAVLSLLGAFGAVTALDQLAILGV